MRTQVGHALRGQREANCMCVATVAVKERTARLERIEQVECRNGPAGAVGFVAVPRNDKRRPAVALHDASSRDADHAPVPAVAVNDDAVSIPQSRFLCEARINLLQNSTLFFLALAIQLVEPGGEFAGTPGVFDTEEFNNVASYIHASCGVQAR